MRTLNLQLLENTLYWFSYIDLITNLYSSIKISRLVQECFFFSSQTFPNLVYPPTMLCDFFIWWNYSNQAKKLIGDIFVFTYSQIKRPFKNNQISTFSAQESSFLLLLKYLNIPRCTLKNILLRNQILFLPLKRYPNEQISNTFLQYYILIRQLTDDLLDYKHDKKIPKHSFVVCNGKNKTKSILRFLRKRIYSTSILPEQYKKHLHYYIRF